MARPLVTAIEEALASGSHDPSSLVVVANGGATNTGAVDPLPAARTEAR